MPTVNLAAMDLNLLVVLDALLREQSVSGAAKRLNATQPGVSRALGRLRASLGDPLLIRTRHGMIPTPTGLAMAPEVRALIEQIQGFFDREPFEPASSRRTFRLTMSEYPQYLVSPPLLARLRAAAPGAGIHMPPWSLGFVEGLESGALDCALCPPTTPVPGLHSEELLTDTPTVIVRRGHPTVKGTLTLAQFAALTHLQIAPNGRAGSLIDDLLAAEGLSRQVVMSVASTLVIPMLVARSDCCATIPSRLAAEMADVWQCQSFPLPLAMPAICLHLVWHERSQHDPGSIWLRNQIKEAVARPSHPRPAAVTTLNLARRAARTL
jgi:DNA-binding transcriptional LysR family regulator